MGLIISNWLSMRPANSNEAEDVYRQLNLVADRFLNISMEYYGCIVTDETIKKGVRKQKAITEMAPLSKASRDFITLARRVADALPSNRSGRSGHWYVSEQPNF